MNIQNTNMGLLILAFVSAVLNFAGFDLVASNADWWHKSLLALTALAVWICLYLFWDYAFSIAPDLKLQGKRLASWLTIVVGCVFITALSAYWNVIALVGNEVHTLTLRDIGNRAQIVLSQAIDESSAYLVLAPQVASLSVHIESLAVGEEQNGAISGTKGSGSISKTLRQNKSKVDAVSGAIALASADIANLKVKGQKCLADLRSSINGEGSPETRGDAVAAGVDCVNETVASLGNQNVVSLIAQGMNGLTAGVVLPVSIKTAKQKQAVQNILTGLQKQADSIADAAAAIKVSPIAPLSAERPNIMMAVLIHWKSIIPPMATAIAIDLLPLLLLILKVILYRDAEERNVPRHPWTAGEMIDAVGQLQRLYGFGGTTNGNQAWNGSNALPAPQPVKLITYEQDDKGWWDVADDFSSTADDGEQS